MDKPGIVAYRWIRIVAYRWIREAACVGGFDRYGGSRVVARNEVMVPLEKGDDAGALPTKK